LKIVVIGNGKSNKLSSRIPGNQDRMQQKEMRPEVSTDKAGILLTTSVAKQLGNKAFGKCSGTINRNLT
jgi:hypothetical protein